jgi:type I restriction enzyme S subunit
MENGEWKMSDDKHQLKQGAMQELLTGKRRLPGFIQGKQSYYPTKFGMMPVD